MNWLFCKDCSHYYYLWQNDYCTRGQISFSVSGAPDVRSWRLCNVERTSEGIMKYIECRCGKSGRYFVQAEKPVNVDRFGEETNGIEDGGL